jgi:hypothetical protein
MISYNTTPAAVAALTRNVIEVWQRATPDQVVRGANWYQTAHELAEVMSEGNTRRGAGVIAALSPMSAWETNLKQAQQALDAESAAGLHTGDAVRKAQRIMDGEDPLSVLPVDSKTWNFFRCIVDPTDPEAVVIDRHAHDIVAGRRFNGEDRGLSNKRRYAFIALIYRMAAQQLDEIPSVVQATTWVVWREES